MRHYISQTYISSNEDGEQQITLEYETGFHRWILTAIKEHTLKVPLVMTEEWVAEGTRWVGKYSRIPADSDKQFELFEIKGRLRGFFDIEA